MATIATADGPLLRALDTLAATPDDAAPLLAAMLRCLGEAFGAAVTLDDVEPEGAVAVPLGRDGQPVA